MTSLRRLKKHASVVGNSRCFRVAVFGQASVGKTAFNVRFVTKRFIGEYDPTLESIYQRAFVVPPNYPVFFEIMDTPGQEENTDVLTEKIRWAHAFILLYSITDRVSFSEIVRLKFLISHTTANNGSQKQANIEPPIVIVGNKSDLEIERMVSTDEGSRMAASLNCYFYEVSVRESVEEVTRVFEDLYRAYHRSTERCAPAKIKAGHSAHFELPTMPHHFHPLPSRRKNKSFKHVDRLPRMQGSVGIQRSIISQSDETSPENVTRAPPSDSRPSVPADKKLKPFPADERPLEATGPQVKSPPEAADAAASDTGFDEEELSSYDNSSSSESSNFYEDDDTVSTIAEEHVKKAAEEFLKKTILLSLE